MQHVVIIHPYLAQAALAAEEERFYRAWLLMRAADEHGTGCHQKDDVAAMLEVELGHSPDTIRKLLRAGTSRWWGIHDGRLWTRSLAKVCQTFACSAGEPVEVDIANITGKLGTWRSICGTTNFSAEHFSKPISQTTMGQRIGKTRKTIGKYVKRARLDVRRNAMPSVKTGELSDEERAAGYYEQHGVIYKHLPNSYRSTLTRARGSIGKAKKIASVGGRTRQGRLQPPVRFVDGPSSKAARVLRRLGEGQVAYIKARFVDGVMLWDGFMAADTQLWRL